MKKKYVCMFYILNQNCGNGGKNIVYPPIYNLYNGGWGVGWWWCMSVCISNPVLFHVPFSDMSLTDHFKSLSAHTNVSSQSPFPKKSLKKNP